MAARCSQTKRGRKPEEIVQTEEQENEPQADGGDSRGALEQQDAAEALLEAFDAGVDFAVMNNRARIHGR